MSRALIELLLGAPGGSGPFGTVVLAVIAVALVAIAVALFRRTRPSPRRSAVEMLAVITVIPLGYGGERTWVFTIQVRPGETRGELLEVLRDRLPEQYRDGAVVFLSLEPNAVGGDAGAFVAPRRPSDIKPLWESSDSAAASGEATWEVAA